MIELVVIEILLFELESQLFALKSIRKGLTFFFWQIHIIYVTFINIFKK